MPVDRMEVADVLSELRKLAEPNNVAIWTAYGVRPSCDFYGVSLTNLKALAKKTGRNHLLALQLWDSAVHDAQLLATYIDEPKKISSLELTQQVLKICSPDLAQKFVDNVVLATPFAQTLASQWTQRDDEYSKQCGFLLIAGLAKKQNAISNAFFQFYLSQIEREASEEQNWVKEAMNLALIGIGKRNEDLRLAVLQVIKNIGAIEVNYGTSSCKTPNPAMALQQ